jgi:hypothetical protein
MELVWRIPSEGAPCARLTNRSSEYDLTPKCLRSFVLLFVVVQTISPAVQFLGELPQHFFPIPPSPWNDVALDVLDGALYLSFHFTGGLLEGFRYGSFFGHTGIIETLRQSSAVLEACGRRNHASPKTA